MVEANDRIWVVAPHADDEVLGAGGVLSRAAKLGAEIHILYASVAGYVPLRGGSSARHEDRRAEADRVLRRLGVAGSDVFPGGNDRHLRFDTVAQHDLVRWLEVDSCSSLAATRPTLLLIPAVAHPHQDHRALHLAALTAARENGALTGGVRRVLSYEVPCAGPSPAGRFSPTVYVQLAEAEVAAKEELFALYASQVSTVPGGRESGAIRILAAGRGLEAGCPYAEAFELLRATHRLP
ncbi:MAG: PIG-L deacetylase family protein [Candidatus Krumholzibacteriia bacterium]